MRQPRDDVRRHGLRFHAPGIVRTAGHPYAGFEPFDGERAAMHQAMLDLEARSPASDYRAVDRDFVAKARRQQESRAGLDQRVTGKMIGPEIFDLLHDERPLDK